MYTVNMTSIYDSGKRHIPKLSQ